MKIKSLIISLTFILSFSAVTAQVTIGSNKPPRDGSLLDLEQDGIPPKGLGLPRVELRSLTELKIDIASEKENYVGTMVYNTTNNGNIKEGIYCWLGDTWKQAIVVNNKGIDGSVLKSNGDGTYGWTQVTFPEYKFHKPTNIRTFKKNNVTKGEYSYSQLTTNSGQGYIKYPNADLFNNKYVYIDTLNIQTDLSIEKFMLLGTSIHTKKSTVNDEAPANTTWESLRIEITLNKLGNSSPMLVKSHQQTINTNSGGSATGYIDIFSVISLTGTNALEKGDYEIKVRVVHLSNTFSYNLSTVTPKGNFRTANNPSFYTIDVDDVNLVIYEYE